MRKFILSLTLCLAFCFSISAQSSIVESNQPSVLLIKDGDGAGNNFTSIEDILILPNDSINPISNNGGSGVGSGFHNATGGGNGLIASKGDGGSNC